MKGKKMPLHVYSDHPNWYDSKMYLNSKDYLDWLSSLQPCEISESELMKIKEAEYNEEAVSFIDAKRGIRSINRKVIVKENCKYLILKMLKNILPNSFTNTKR